MPPRHHIDELQSLRGVAALAVAVSHISSIYALPPNVRIAIDLVLNAHACIIVFFVLSGYVLTRSLLRRGLSWPGVQGFYVGRVFRLFPALWVASALSALFLWLSPQQLIHPAMSRWFYFYLTPFPSAKQVVLGLVAIDKTLIMPVWTIFIELAGSFVMPLLVAASLSKLRLLPGIVLATGFAAYLLPHAPHRLDSLVYLFDFALGAWLASRPWGLFARRSLPGLMAAASVLIFFRFAWDWYLSGQPMPLYYGYNHPVPLIVEGLAAFVLVGMLAAEHGHLPMLRNAGAIWLGNVSYSLYLIHFPVAVLTVKALSHVFTDATNGLIATATLMAITLPIAFALAGLTYRFVELPAIALGKRAAKSLFADHAAVKVS